MFKNAEVTPDVLLASACLPTMFQAVEIDGEAYWDGGYSGNPTLSTLVRECKSHDTILVPINPDRAPGRPAQRERDPEPSERGVLQRRRPEGTAHDGASAQGRRSRRRRGQALGADARALVENTIMTKLGASSKLNAEWAFFSFLRDEGRKVGADVPRRPRDGSRQALDARHRRPARGNLSAWGFSAFSSRSGF